MQAFGREVVPHLASGRIVAARRPRLPGARRRAAAFDRLEEPGKLGKVLLDFER